MDRFPVDRDSVDVTDVNQRTALHWAAAHGRHDQVPGAATSLLQAKILTKLGADIGLIDVEGRTPVHWAAATAGEDSARLVTLLIGLQPRCCLHVQFVYLICQVGVADSC